MNKSHFVIAMLTLVFTGVAQAQPARVFVGAQGNDGNPCTAAAPCRTFQRAHDTVAANGEVDVLSPAGYGSLTITKPISIQGHGFSGISVGNPGTAITVAVGASDKVSLNGLIIDAGENNGAGIEFGSAGRLTVANCIIRGAGNGGIRFMNGQNNTAVLTVLDSYFADNGAAIFVYPQINSGTNVSNLRIQRSTFYGNASGVAASTFAPGETVNMEVTDSVFANHPATVQDSGNGFALNTGGNDAGNVNLVLTRTVITGNARGIWATQQGANTAVWLGGSTLTENSTGYEVTGGAVLHTFQDNYINGNATNIGSLTAAPLQ